MTATRRERVVDAPVEAVWRVLADFDGIAGWAESVDHSCLLSPRSAGAGTHRRVQSGRTVLVEKVIVWEPGARLAYELVGLPPVVQRATNEWTLAPYGDKSRVSLTVDVSPGRGPVARLAAAAIARRIDAVNGRLLDGLAAMLRDPEAVP